MSITYTESNSFLNDEFGKTPAHSPVATYYLGLSTGTILVDGTGAVEPAVGAYARVAVTNNKTSWSAAALGIVSNAIEIAFIESTASWGTITDVAIYDAVSGGNVLYFEALDTPRAVDTLTTVLFGIGGLQIKMDNS